MHGKFSNFVVISLERICQPISPQVGEMSGRTERGVKERGITALPFSPPELVEGTERRWPKGAG
jgi:hypothetical protein